MKKMNLKNIKSVLSRTEMKKIMAGSGQGTCCICFDLCTGATKRIETTSDCGTVCNGGCEQSGGGCGY